MLSGFDSFHRSLLIKLLIVLFVLAVALTGAIPGYVNGQWAWRQIPEISQLKLLKVMQKNGLSLPGWQTLEQKTVEIGGHKWSAQAIVPEAKTKAVTPSRPVWLLLRPQTWSKDMPQIDWTDINGVQQWTVDAQRQLSFAVKPVSLVNSAEAQVNARFFRGWSHKRTDAVLQWYAWSNGGHPSPSHWFWADQLMQLHDRQRLAWVAVSIQIPIKPLGEIDPVQSEAKALAELVQSTLISEVFQ